jgi:dienelactone hydrolase
MRKYEFVFNSVNSEIYPKPITVLVMEPDNIDKNTGAMLFTHGWAGNRFQHQDKMEYTVDKFNLVCISVEYRMSGFDFDPVTGHGAYLPYDASFYQVFDVLNGFREVIKFYPQIEHKRFYHYGGSQGGHIALLSSMYVPNTFAFIYASCPLTHLDNKFCISAGRSFAKDELSIRNIYDHADLIQTPIYVEHGTADTTVNYQRHSQALESCLNKLNKRASFKYYKGGEHDLMPAISKLDAFKENVPQLMTSIQRDCQNDFLQNSKVKISTPGSTLIIDWSQPAHSIDLFHWKKRVSKCETEEI